VISDRCQPDHPSPLSPSPSPSPSHLTVPRHPGFAGRRCRSRPERDQRILAASPDSKTSGSLDLSDSGGKQHRLRVRRPPRAARYACWVPDRQGAWSLDPVRLSCPVTDDPGGVVARRKEPVQLVKAIFTALGRP
jgi:hypothetical protein